MTMTFNYWEKQIKYKWKNKEEDAEIATPPLWQLIGPNSNAAISDYSPLWFSLRLFLLIAQSQ